MISKQTQTFILAITLLRKGRITGIFQHWEGPGQAKEQVMRFNGAEHKSFRTEIEAIQWMNIGRTELCDSDGDEPPPLIESDSDGDDDEDVSFLD